MHHHVLYCTAHPGAVPHPLASREAGDPDMRDDFTALRVDVLNRARAAGAVRPTFKVVLEDEGFPVQSAEKSPKEKT